MQHNRRHGNNFNEKTSFESKHSNDFIMYKICLELSKEFKEARRNKRSVMWCGDQQL
jgi:hypothetical protein